MLYVNDILLERNNIDLFHEFKIFISNNFENKDLWDTSFFIGIQMLIYFSRGILGQSQISYIVVGIQILRGFSRSISMKDIKP